MITKFLWADLRASPPQLFGREGDRLHGVGAYDWKTAAQLAVCTM